MSDVSERLLELIQTSKMSYNDLSNITGIPKSALQRYATGETEKIPLDRIDKLANALNSTAEYILGWDSPETRTALDTPRWDDERAKTANEIFTKLPAEKKDEAVRYLRFLADLKDS